MSITVQNNASALLALQTLNKTGDQLSQVQDQIASGLLVNEAKDNPVVWATAKGQGAEIDGLASVTSSLNRASSISDVALSAGQTVLDLLNQMKQKALAASDTQQQPSDLSALNVDFQGLLGRISTTLSSASFDGSNLLDGFGGNLRFLATADASQVVTLPARNLSLGGSLITLASTTSLPSASTASAVAAQLDVDIANVTQALADIGDQAKLIGAHNDLISQLATVLKTGHGKLVDADTEADSARLAALQVKQQLGEQSLNIANTMPQVLLSLFK